MESKIYLFKDILDYIKNISDDDFLLIMNMGEYYEEKSFSSCFYF